MAAGSQHTCAIDASDRVRCWGRGASGQLGDGEALNQVIASTVQREDGELIGALDIEAGWFRTCATTSDGVYCWGAAAQSLFDPPVRRDKQLIAKQVDNLALSSADRPALPFAFLAVGPLHQCVADAQPQGPNGQDQMRCWGQTINYETYPYDNDPNPLGPAASPYTWGFLDGYSVVAIDVADNLTVAILDDGTTRDVCHSGEGKLALPGMFSGWACRGPDPDFIPEDVASGYEHACMFGNAPTPKVRCWGNPDDLRLGSAQFTSAPQYDLLDVIWQ